MNEPEEPTLAGPNWSPTGNSGQWVWDEHGELDSRTEGRRPCWKWYDEVYGWGWKAHDLFKDSSPKQIKQKKNWVKRMLGL